MLYFKKIRERDQFDMQNKIDNELKNHLMHYHLHDYLHFNFIAYGTMHVQW